MVKEDDSHQDTKQDFEIQFEIISSFSVIIFSALQLYVPEYRTGTMIPVHCKADGSSMVGIRSRHLQAT